MTPTHHYWLTVLGAAVMLLTILAAVASEAVLTAEADLLEPVCKPRSNIDRRTCLGYNQACAELGYPMKW